MQQVLSERKPGSSPRPVSKTAEISPELNTEGSPAGVWSPSCQILNVFSVHVHDKPANASRATECSRLVLHGGPSPAQPEALGIQCKTLPPGEHHQLPTRSLCTLLSGPPSGGSRKGLSPHTTPWWKRQASPVNSSQPTTGPLRVCLSNQTRNRLQAYTLALWLLPHLEQPSCNTLSVRAKEKSPF